MTATLADAIATPSGVSINSALGRQAAAATRSVNLSNEDLAAINALATKLDTLNTAVASTTPSPVELGPFNAKTVAASQTAAVLGATGAVGDYLYGFHIQPTTTSPGNVIVYDGSMAIYTFTGGASSVNSLVPFSAVIAANCANAGWKVTTGANVTVTAIGKFT